MTAVRSAVAPGGAGVGHVVDGDAGLADLLLELLADPEAAADQVAGGEDAHVLHRHAGVGQAAEGRLGGEVDRVLVGVLPELGHVIPRIQTPSVSRHRVLLRFAERFEAEADGLGALAVGAEQVRGQPDLHARA